MAMGVSTERNPFKPCTPSPLWFVQPPIMTQPIVPSSTSSHPFSFSLEPFHRRDLHLLHGANSLSPVITLLRSRGLITCSRSFSTEDARYIDCGRQDYQSPTYSKLALWLEQNSLSRSPYRMLPGYIYLKRVLREQHRRSIVYAQKVASGGSVRLKVMDQENKTINRYFHEELVRDIEDVSLSRFRNYRSPRSTFPGVKGNRNDWVGEADKIKQERPSTSKDVLASHVKTDGPHLRSRNGNSKIGSYIFRQDQGRCSVLSGDLPNDTDEISSPKAKTNAILNAFNETHIKPILTGEECIIRQAEHRKRLSRIYEKVLVVDNISVAKEIVKLLITKYRHLVHACDTEVAKIDARHETPVGHGEMICFSIFSGEGANFGGGKSCIWVDVLDGGGREILMEFAPFFENPSIKKVWHNYSFDSHIIENYGLKVSGFHADTMHMARLWDSSRQIDGGYSLEALTSDPKVMSGKDLGKKKVMSMGGDLIGKISMRTIFGKKKLKKDGDEGKIITIAPVEELQREERLLWICYSALDSISTLKLFESLKAKLMAMHWNLDESHRGSMYDFYEQYWRPFGELLVKVETEGMLVNRAYLAEVEKVAVSEREVAGNKFRKWASRYCHDALYMNVGSDAQLRQLFFGGMVNRNDETKALPKEKSFKVPNVEKVIEKGKKVAMKFRNITLSKIGERIETEVFTATGWPSVSVDVLNVLAGKVSSEYNWNGEIYNPTLHKDESDFLSYGTAYAAFGGGKEGREACHAIAALREVCSIGSLISYFILPLQSNNISGKTGRIHCSLNINTETGRLSARRPNLQNQPALEKDRYRIRQAFVAAPGNSLIIADYGQLELRILAHLTNCKSMLEAFKAGGDFHSRTAMNMYPHIREAVENKQVLLEWHPKPGEEIPPVPLLKDAFASERRKAKMLNFSIAYGKTPVGLARDWKVSVQEARKTVHLWYKQRQEVLSWQKERKKEATTDNRVYTLLGRARTFPSMATTATRAHKSHIERAAINTPVQGSAADVAMCAMLEISSNARLKDLGWRLLLQIHDELILEGPTEFAEEAKGIIVHCMTKPFHGSNFLKVDLSVDVKSVQNWFAAK